MRPQIAEHLPTRVEWMRYDGSRESAEAIVSWLGRRYAYLHYASCRVMLKTRRRGHPERPVERGDCVIRTPHSRYAHCVEGDVFDKLYGPAATP